MKNSVVRPLGFWMCVALVVGNMIGSGVFMLPASLAPYGWNAVAGWILTIGGALCLAFVFARLAKAFPQGGGPYIYTQEAFGPAAGFMVAWSYWISIWVGNAAIAAGTVSYLSVFYPQIATQTGLHCAITLVMIWGLTIMNCFGARLAGGMQVVTTALKLLPLMGVILLAAVVLGKTGGSTVLPFHAQDLTPVGITAAATLTLWALLGMESATVPAGKVVDPERTIPRATLVGTAFAGVIYLIVCSAVVLLTPTDMLKTSNAPFADFVGLYGGGDARLVLAGFAAISGFGALNGWMLLQGEVPYAMAKGGVFPAFLAKTSRRGAPVRAHVLSSLFLTVLVTMNYAKSMVELFTFMALLATAISLFAYLFCAMAALRLQSQGRMEPSRAVTVVAIIATIYSFWTLYGAGEASLWSLALLAVGLPIHWLIKRFAVVPDPE